MAAKGSGAGIGGPGISRGAGRPRSMMQIGESKFVKSARSVREEQVLVNVSVAKLDKAFKKSGQYIKKGGKGGIPGRRESFRDFQRTGKPIEASEVHYDSKAGKADFRDGRHRFSVLRDQGKRRIAIAVARSQVRRVKRDLG